MLQHAKRMDRNGLPKQALQYKKMATTCIEYGHKQNILQALQYKQMWLEHVQRMDTKRLPKQVLT